MAKYDYTPEFFTDPDAQATIFRAAVDAVLNDEGTCALLNRQTVMEKLHNHDPDLLSPSTTGLFKGPKKAKRVALAHQTVGAAMDRYFARRDRTVSLRWNQYIMQSLVGDQPVTEPTAAALFASIYRDHRFSLLGSDSLGNTLHKLEAPIAEDKVNIYGHELLAPQLADLMRHWNIAGKHSPRMLIRTALEAMQINPLHWSAEDLSYLLRIQPGVVTHMDDAGDVTVEIMQ